MALCHEAIRLAHINPGRLGLLGAPTFPMLQDSTQRQFFDVLGKVDLPFDFHRAENRVTLTQIGSDILFRSVDHFERLRGPNLAWFGLDELTYMEPDAWLRLEARLRDPKARHLCGFGVFTPKGFDWAYQKFLAGRKEGYELVEAEPFENKFVLDAVPDFYQRLERSYDPLFYEQEVLGHFLNIRQGRAYYGFTRFDHAREALYDPKLPLCWAWDFNLSPMSSVICQEHGEEIWVLDELVLPTSSTPEVCREFMNRYGEHHGKLVIYGDASGGTAHTVTGTSDYQLIRQFFRGLRQFQLEVNVPLANPPVRDRLNTVNARLVNAAGERALLVDSRCKELIADFEQVVYKAGTTQIDKDSDPKRTHTSDALGYYLWQQFRPLPLLGEKSKRLIS